MMKVARCDVKPLKRIQEAGNGQVAQKPVKHSQGMADLFRMGRVLDRIERPGTFDEADGAPEGTVGVDPVIPGLPSWKDSGNFPPTPAVRRLTLQPVPHVLCEGSDIAHHPIRVPKHMHIDTLEDEVSLVPRIQGDKKGIVDVAVSKSLDVRYHTPGFELLCSGTRMVQCTPSHLLRIVFNSDGESALGRLLGRLGVLRFFNGLWNRPKKLLGLFLILFQLIKDHIRAACANRDFSLSFLRRVPRNITFLRIRPNPFLLPTDQHAHGPWFQVEKLSMHGSRRAFRTRLFQTSAYS